MTTRKRVLTFISIMVVAAALAPAPASAGDKSFSSVVKHLKRNYNAKGQGTFGMISFARLMVKMIRPAGVKNFKVAILKELDYSRMPGPESADFHSFVRKNVSREWQPLAQYSSSRNKQWTYVYVNQLQKDVRLLVVTLQQREAVVVQLKFSPEKLIKFIDDPKIMGMSLKGNGGASDKVEIDPPAVNKLNKDSH